MYNWGFTQKIQLNFFKISQKDCDYKNHDLYLGSQLYKDTQLCFVYPESQESTQCHPEKVSQLRFCRGCILKALNKH